MMIKNLLNILCVLIFLLHSNIGLTEEGKKNNLIIIIDSSRSMLQLTRDGKEKLWSAKTAINKLIDKLPNDTNVGFMVFGHREKNKCDDIEIMLPVEPLSTNRAIIKEKIDMLKPKGVTPLTASLDQAAKHLEKFRGKSTILLLTDGKETCGGNPEELVSNILVEHGITVIVDVVGLNVTAIERKQLEAIAKAGGGNYYSANTSYGLSEAIFDIAEERVIEIKVNINSSSSGEVKETETLTDKDLGTLLINYSHILNSIYIYKKDTKQRVDGKAMWIHLENQYSTYLEPGLYMIELNSTSMNEPIKIDNVKINPNKKTTINID